MLLMLLSSTVCIYLFFGLETRKVLAKPYRVKRKLGIPVDVKISLLKFCVLFFYFILFYFFVMERDKRVSDIEHFCLSSLQNSHTEYNLSSIVISL